ncbi:FAD-dependent monooxygenase [Devosia rhizoryzae]|uniref:FAD-dependent monooxygenase n=1 Tax=Devosia rhizoryzae TaxID=2774137 RepID=A0ABX7C2G2_9HYPH|nr:FAD-dependent monooxygenase [Devosia rhizoryzae]QQR38415.1 FAD-dependent monooxygenase [Devosia rhizoryzae]
MRIAVIGAGIGGLSAAIGLRRVGAGVTLFERAADLRAAGSGLSIFGNGARALEALGLGEQFRAEANSAGIFVGGQRRPDGRWLSRTPQAALSQLRVIDRQHLHDMLQAATAGIAVQTGVLASADTGGTVCWTSDGIDTAEQFDLVVAADGIHSRIRQDVWGDVTPLRYAGYSAWRGITAEPVDLRGEAGETWGHGERFGIAPLADGRIYWFAVASMPAGTSFADEFAEVRRRFVHWHDPIGSIIERTRPADVFRRDIYDLSQPLRSFVNDKVVLLGDAAHAMTPDLGQGGNQAMEDAATLAALLAPLAARPAPQPDALRHALARYDQLRRSRTQAIARDARRLGAFAHVKGTLGVWGRDLMMRLIPPRVMAGRLVALQDWQPPAATPWSG